MLRCHTDPAALQGRPPTRLPLSLSLSLEGSPLLANKGKGEVVLGQQTGWLSPGCGGSVRPLRWKQQQPHKEVLLENDLTVKLCNPSRSGERYIHAHSTKADDARGTRDRCSQGLCSASPEGPQNRISQQALFDHDNNKNKK